MKKIYQIIILCVMSLALTGCVESEESKISAYKSAIKEDDFEKAHDILASLRSDYEEEEARGSDKSDVLNKAKTYVDGVSAVYEAEARFIMASNSDDVYNKLIYLFNEYPSLGKKMPEGKVESKVDEALLYELSQKSLNQFALKVIDLAINNKNEEIVKLAISNMKENCIVEDGWNDFVEYSYEDILEAGNRYLKAIENNKFDLDAEEKEERISKIIESQLESQLEKILDISLPIKPSPGLCNAADNPEYYRNAVKDYNSKCYKLLRQAFSYNEMKFAEKILGQFKKNCIVIGGNTPPTKVDGVRVDEVHCYIKYTWEDKEEALKEYKKVFGKQPTKTEKSKSHRIK